VGYLASHELYEMGRILFQLRRRRAAIAQPIPVRGTNDRAPDWWDCFHRPAIGLVFGDQRSVVG
jgi:hypothetical protein